MMLEDYVVEKYNYMLHTLQVSNDTVVVNGSIHFKSSTLAHHLSGCTHGAIMAATLGHEVDRILRQQQYISMSQALQSDNVANVLIEALCDKLQEEIAQLAKAQGYYITARYSPGYGDFLLEHQNTLLKLSGVKGITLTPSNLLLPQKSVTAIIGFKKEPPILTAHKCDNCNSRHKCNKSATS